MMQFNIPIAFIWMERLIAIAVILQTVEFLQIRQSFSVQGIWTWTEIRREFSPSCLRSLLGIFLNDRAFLILMGIRLLFAVAGLFFSTWAVWVFLWFSTVLVAVRWRGTFNGGSDYMTSIVLMAISVGRIFGGDSPRGMSVALGYVGLQTCLSYFVAGVVKLKQADWRNGSALVGFLGSAYYAVPNWVRRLNARSDGRGLIRNAARAIVIFECAFPVALLGPTICLLWIGMALLFQIANAYIFGLNRFFWAWLAAYPALYWCSGRLALL